MIKILFSILFVCIAFTGFSQKVKIKDNVATVDGKPYVNFKNDVAQNTASVSGINAANDEIMLTWLSYSDPNNVSSANPEGKVRWVELNFFTLNLKCEIASSTKKMVVKFLYNNNIYVDGILNEENVKMCVAKYGNRYSENRPGGVTVIINN